MTYQRVIPRDLFNEAKLLKCLGQLALHLHDYPIAGVEFYQETDTALEVWQNENTGGLYVSPENLSLTINDRHVSLYTRYNSKDNYPLMAETFDCECVTVFDEQGKLTPDFLNFIEAVKGIYIDD